MWCTCTVYLQEREKSQKTYPGDARVELVRIWGYKYIILKSVNNLYLILFKLTCIA